MCLYDLQKAYDSVEYSVLLNRMFEVGINGRTWRLVRSWYEGARCHVKWNELCQGVLKLVGVSNKDQFYHQFYSS